ncbi:hypothetical protein B0H13DRAFT_1591813, partial [Mycena leptocephala]
KPQHTLAVIICCAILGSACKRLTIQEIYTATEEKYPYYRTSCANWKASRYSPPISNYILNAHRLSHQQSVRHNLSLNRLFERQPRPTLEPGSGSYWTVNLTAPREQNVLASTEGQRRVL